MKKPFIIYRSKDNKFYFVFHARNGRVLVTSETYTRKGNAIKGISSLVTEIGMNSFNNISELIEDQTK